MTIITGFCSSVWKRITSTAPRCVGRTRPSKERTEQSECHTMKLLHLRGSPQTYSTVLTHPQRVPFQEASFTNT